jgi:hypothetical protein
MMYHEITIYYGERNVDLYRPSWIKSMLEEVLLSRPLWHKERMLPLIEFTIDLISSYFFHCYGIDGWMKHKYCGSMDDNGWNGQMIKVF